jgi:hypothetical protein
MLAMTAERSGSGEYFYPGAQSAEEALNAIGAILYHEDVAAGRAERSGLRSTRNRLPAAAGPNEQG